MSRLYRQVYAYILAMLILSLMLTGASIFVLFNHREQGVVVRTFRRQVLFMRHEVQSLQLIGILALRLRLAELSQQLGWEMAYWHQGLLLYSSVAQPPALPQSVIRQLYTNNHAIPLNALKPTQLVISVFPRQPERGVIWLQLNLADLRAPLQGPLIFVGLILLFLAILLIPVVRFLLRPYRDLQNSIQQLSEGNFESALDEERYPAFADLTRSFNLMRSRIQQMIEQKQRLVADVSHELRSPLTRLRVLLELWHQRYPDAQDLLHRSSSEIEELDRIIDDVLEISRLQLHHVPIKRSVVDLTWLLYEAAEQHQELLERKFLELVVEIPTEPVRIQADERLLKRVFNNLFGNLVKYVSGPGQVNLSLSLAEQQVCICLRDRGPGIPENDLIGIFTPFYRLDQSRSRRTGGVGLGLAIVWEIVQAHHGQVEARSPRDGQEGLEIEIRLPREWSAENSHEYSVHQGELSA